ncbi:hypothetical protein BDD12DRAFT_734829 [Trichophaea hybrida]|nr:hypothetical protein BDD12DRAFT_734829 [Trichophaea hybrida]
MKQLIFQEDPNLEVEHEAVFTWEIINWRKMDRRTHSPVFTCGDSPWRILFFPYGNNCDCASFYLEHGFEDKPPEDWYRCVQFGLVLWNKNEPASFVHHQAHHRFTADEADWGFTRFVELRELLATSDKRPRPLVEDDSAQVTAYVRVMKDPTGVLWHNFINYDSKKETGFVGLKNQGATCYLNSLLQSLYFTNSFRKAVYKIPTEHETVANSALTLQRLFYRLQTHTDAVPTLELTKSFGWETQDIFAQQDVQELNRILMENLENKMKGTEVENLLNKMFVGKTKTYIKCINVDYGSERIEDFWDIQLNVRGYKNLDESFKNYIAVETMDGENKYFAEGHGLQDARKGVIFESFPDVLHLHLKRFEYDLNTYAMQKVNDHYEFPEVFDAAPYLSEEADKNADWEYVLHGVLVHSGDLNAGHYYAFLRPQKDGEFFKFDDDRVTRATRREALDENFGGDYSLGGNHDGVRNQVSRQLSIKRSMNAYMLVYLRRNKVDEILVPVTEADAPEHLPKRFEEERQIALQRKRDREEQHLYLYVRIITQTQFTAHQGFDLASWDDKDSLPEAQPIGFRFKKAKRMGELVELIAKEHGYGPEQLRLWVMVNRQNKTVRPDQPLTDLDKTVEETQLKHNSKSNDFRLWVEATEQSKLKDMPFNKDPSPNSPWIVVFLKQYDPWQPTLLGVTHVYMRRNDKVQEILPVICELMNWPPKTEILLFEEIKPTMIEPIKPKQSFHQAEIQDGDIICFQKTPTEKEYETLKEKRIPKDAKEFYDYLVNLTTVRFIPKNPQYGKDFMLSLSKKNAYDEVAERVGAQLNVPPTHLRFMLVNAQTGAPRQPIKRTPTLILSQMVTPQYYSATPTSHNQLCYEVLDMSLAELETKKPLRFIWLPEGISKEEPAEALVPKAGTISDVIPYIMKRFNVSEQAVDRIRFFTSHAGKFHKEIPPNYSVVSFQEYTTLYCELVPEEEINCNLDVCRIIEAFHFQKEPSKTHNAGVPFKFVVKKDERFEDTKARLQARTGIKGKPFEKIKFALVKKSSFSKPIYLNDDDTLYDCIDDSEDLLGLDHVDRNSRNGWGRVGGPEIRIK